MHMQVCTPRTRLTEVYVRVCTSIEYQCGIHVRSATKESDTLGMAHFFLGYNLHKTAVTDNLCDISPSVGHPPSPFNLLRLLVF